MQVYIWWLKVIISLTFDRFLNSDQNLCNCLNVKTTDMKGITNFEPKSQTVICPSFLRLLVTIEMIWVMPSVQRVLVLEEMPTNGRKALISSHKINSILAKRPTIEFSTRIWLVSNFGHKCLPFCWIQFTKQFLWTKCLPSLS